MHPPYEDPISSLRVRENQIFLRRPARLRCHKLAEMPRSFRTRKGEAFSYMILLAKVTHSQNYRSAEFLSQTVSPLWTPHLANVRPPSGSCAFPPGGPYWNLSPISVSDVGGISFKVSFFFRISFSSPATFRNFLLYFEHPFSSSSVVFFFLPIRRSDLRAFFPPFRSNEFSPSTRLTPPKLHFFPHLPCFCIPRRSFSPPAPPERRHLPFLGFSLGNDFFKGPASFPFQGSLSEVLE